MPAAAGRDAGNSLGRVSELPADAPWFVSTAPRPDADVVILGFPHAGGGCASLSPLNAGLPQDVELQTLNLPGRQARFVEENRTDLDGLIADLATAVAEQRGRSVVLFGYCTGALLAYLVADALRSQGMAEVRHLAVASYPAPDKYRPWTDLHPLPSDLFWQRLREMGGVPAVVIENEEFRPILEPSLRADFELFAAYEPVARSPLDVPVTGIEGDHDELDPEGITAGWARVTSRDFERVRLDAGHWLVDDAPQDLARVLGEIALAARQ